MGLDVPPKIIMATTSEWHDRVTASIGGAENYGKGIWPNPWVDKMAIYERWERAHSTRFALTHKIMMLTEPRFITSTETSLMLEALAVMISARQVLELGTHTGRTALHLLRALVGIDGAKLVSIDARPTHDREFFAQPEIAKHFEFIEGWTPDALGVLKGRQFDFCFIDSDHSVEHTKKELEALKPLTHPGSMLCFHDCPEWQSPSHHAPPPVRLYLESLIQSGEFSGMMLPSPRQLDGMEEWGADYDTRLSPGLAVLIRK